MVTLREIVMIHDVKRQGIGISAIARRTGLDRKTVRKYLDQGMESARYGPRQPRPRLIDPYADYLRGRIAAFPGLSGSTEPPRRATPPARTARRAAARAAAPSTSTPLSATASPAPERGRERPARPHRAQPRGPEDAARPGVPRRRRQAPRTGRHRRTQGHRRAARRGARRAREPARRATDLSAWLGRWQAKYPALTDWVEDKIATTGTFYRLPRQHHKHLKSTNMLERLNEEIRRRTRVVRISRTATAASAWSAPSPSGRTRTGSRPTATFNMDFLKELRKEELRRAA